MHLSTAYNQAYGKKYVAGYLVPRLHFIRFGIIRAFGDGMSKQDNASIGNEFKNCPIIVLEDMFVNLVADFSWELQEVQRSQGCLPMLKSANQTKQFIV
jgi:hypothetical protein